MATAVGYGQAAQVYGLGGIGKSSVLRAVAYASARPDLAPDGLLWLGTARRPLEDVVQELISSWYVASGRWFSWAEASVLLGELNAVLVLDDMAADRHGVDALLDLMPASAIVFSAVEQNLWRDGVIRHLTGLAVQDGVALLVRHLHRQLSDKELPVARRLVVALDGNPMRIEQASAELHRRKQPLTPLLLPELQQLSEQLIAALTPLQRATLSALQCTGPVSLPLLAQLVGIPPPQAATVVDGLRTAGLAATDDGTLTQIRSAALNLTPAEEAASVLGWITATRQWVAQPGRTTEEIGAQAAAVLSVAQAGMRHGRVSEVCDLARAAAPGLAVSLRWGTWAAVLKIGINAAQAANRPADAAYFWHEQGVKLLCAQDPYAAAAALREAIGLRDNLGDTVGATLSRAVLALITQQEPRLPGKRRPRVVAAATIALLLALGGVIEFAQATSGAHNLGAAVNASRRRSPSSSSAPKNQPTSSIAGTKSPPFGSMTTGAHGGAPILGPTIKNTLDPTGTTPAPHPTGTAPAPHPTGNTPAPHPSTSEPAPTQILPTIRNEQATAINCGLSISASVVNASNAYVYWSVDGTEQPVVEMTRTLVSYRAASLKPAIVEEYLPARTFDIVWSIAAFTWDDHYTITTDHTNSVPGCATLAPVH